MERLAKRSVCGEWRETRHRPDSGERRERGRGEK